MTDEELVRKKLHQIESFVSQLEALGRPSEIDDDIVQERFVQHTLQIAIQASLDVAAHIVADERLGEPNNNAELFRILARHGWISRDLAATMKEVVGFRNVVVHGYADVDLRIVRDVAEHRVADLLTYVSEIRQRLTP